MMLNRLSLNRIGLNRIGLNRIGKPSGGSSARPYIDPEVLASLVAVCICDGKSNNDPDRAVIKNLVDPDNPFVISNAAYKLNSGYGKYEVDFTSWSRLIGVKAFSNKFVIENKAFNCAYYVRDTGEDLDEFKAKINNHTDGIIRYTYINQDGIVANLDISPDDSNRVFTFPKSYNSIEGVANHICGFQTPMFVNTGIIIEQIPSHQGAFVTDGKDDLITSTKTVKEMLGGSNEVTVVSMVHQINLSADVNTSINNIRSESVAHVCARHLNTAYGKTGIFGYSKQLNTTSNPTLINNILGDKKDYIADGNSVIDTTDKYFVQGYKYNDSLYELSEVAVYWTFISNKVLTTDEINQIIGYFKLDKYVTPQVIYDVKRQGLTNDTPAADWYLKDFSGNGHDMQLYNYAKSKNSGIGKYAEDFTTWNKYPNVVVTKDKITVTDKFNQDWLVYKYSKSSSGISPMRIKITGIPINARIEYRYVKTSSDTASSSFDILEDGIYDIPESFIINDAYSVGFKLSVGDWTHIEITQIPDYEGALVSDGKDDYGKAEGLPILKDYTVAADYARLSYGNVDSAIISKSYAAGNGAFGFNLASGQSPNNVSAISFGTGSAKIQADDNYRKIRYQSKYVNDGITINAGNGIDGNEMWLSCLRENYNFSESALYSMLLFPYSLSEFLLERQLKKYKLGTLYPGMIEWRPKVNINVPVVTPPTFSMNNGSDIITNGQYIPEGTEITIRIFTTTDSSVGGINEATAKINGVDIELSPSGNKTYYGGKFIVSSKQKIDITIDEYIRYEDIVQPYPAIINLKQDGKTITWGDKLKVGSDIVFVGSANLLPELYTVSDTRYNGVTLYPNTIIKVEKSMVFDNARTYLKANEPSCILSPNRLRIPNSSYKILGYIPDLTGKGNHGKLNNFAYTEDSGVASDGSIKIDGTDDHITISNIIGGKCIMAKVTVNRNSGIIYDQRRANVPNKSWMQLNPSSVIFEQNAVSTYIDGILNHNVTGSDLVSKTVNLTCELEIGDTSGTYQPTIGSSYAVGYTTDINLYEFMLFPDVPDEEEIKELNDVMGIENNIEVS